MADIELVIKISEEKYKWIKENNPEADNDSIVGVIVHGTPLPKEHGRLIDADVYKWENRDIIDCEIDHPKYQVTLEELIDDAPTIIEADKAERSE